MRDLTLTLWAVARRLTRAGMVVEGARVRGRSCGGDRILIDMVRWSWGEEEVGSEVILSATGNATK